jgi:hypothetical protein
MGFAFDRQNGGQRHAPAGAAPLLHVAHEAVLTNGTLALFVVCRFERAICHDGHDTIEADFCPLWKG